MDAERMDSLDGWVSVKSGLFAETQRPRLRFLAAWNEVEGKFAVTCHNRQLQARAAEPEAPAPSSWAALYSPQELCCIHRVLAASCAALERCFPALPELRPRGLWGLLFPGSSLAEGSEPGPDLDSVCRQLELYLDAAIELCGHRIALDTLFPEGEVEDYFESVSELRGRSLEQRVASGREALRKVREVDGFRSFRFPYDLCFYFPAIAVQELILLGMEGPKVQVYTYRLQSAHRFGAAEEGMELACCQMGI